MTRRPQLRHLPLRVAAAQDFAQSPTRRDVSAPIKLNAQATIMMIENLQIMHEKSLPPTGAQRRMELEYQDWARLQGRGPLAHTGGRNDLLVGWRIR